MANYPTSAPSFPTRSAGQTIDASHVNSLQDEVVAMGGGLINGTAPLHSSNSTVANLSVTGGSTQATLSVTGDSTLAGNLTLGGILSFRGAFYRQAIEPITLGAGNTDDQTIQTSATIVELTPNAAGSTLTGVRVGVHGRTVTFVNISANPLVIATGAVGSSAENRFQCPRSSNLSMEAGTAVDAYYSTGSLLWRIIGGTRSV